MPHTAQKEGTADAHRWTPIVLEPIRVNRRGSTVSFLFLLQMPELIRMSGVVAAPDVKDEQESFMAEIGKGAHGRGS
jgi:hypothetical protein